MGPASVQEPLAAPKARHRRPSGLTIAFLLLSVLLSVLDLAVRNNYDDEFSSLAYVDTPLREVVRMANSADVHPPGMYVLADLAYAAIPSGRWMTVFALLLLYAGLIAFVLRVASLFRTRAEQAVFLLLACVHPQFLLWGNTIRWYSWWTGVALVAVLIALQPGERSPEAPPAALRYGRAVLLGFVLAVLFYINYVTLVFGVALGAAMLLRYRLRPLGPYLVTVALFAGLIVPQLHAFLYVHIPGGGDQRAGIGFSFARLVQGTFASEAFLPWHPLALAAVLLFTALLGWGLWTLVGAARRGVLLPQVLDERRGLSSLVVFALCLFVLLGLAGVGIKPRNALLLLPVLAVPCALVVGGLRRPGVQWAVFGLLALWSADGMSHLLRREGMAKANMNNRPEQVVNYVRQSEGAGCAVVVTYDWMAAYTLGTSHMPRTMLFDTGKFPGRNNLENFALSGCSSIRLYRIASSMSGFGAEYQAKLGREMASLDALGPRLDEVRLSPDPDARRKRELSHDPELPDFRYVVEVSAMQAGDLPRLRASLGEFRSLGGPQTDH